MPYRHTITFVATDVKKKRSYPGESTSTYYEVRYDPPIGRIKRTFGASFSNLLLEALCGLPKYNTTPCIVKIIMIGPFPIKYKEETKKVFDLYARAERIGVEFEICNHSV